MERRMSAISFNLALDRRESDRPLNSASRNRARSPTVVTDAQATTALSQPGIPLRWPSSMRTAAVTAPAAPTSRVRRSTPPCARDEVNLRPARLLDST
jgi:hypothetical protein